MIILEDTRNKPSKNAHITKQLESLGYTVERTKLYCGDYTLPTNQSVCIDTKQDLQEVVGNVTKQHDRFKRGADGIEPSSKVMSLCSVVELYSQTNLP